MDVDNYRIQVHALKSTSRTIGATALSDEALALENAAKSGDIEYITGNTERVLTDYNAVLEQIRAVLEAPAQTAAEVSGRVLYV